MKSLSKPRRFWQNNIVITTQFVLREAHSLFQSEFSKESDLVLPPQVSSILSFHHGHRVAAYNFFLIFPSPLYCFLFTMWIVS